MTPELKTRWNRMLVQAEEFEEVDKFEEARARAHQVLDEVEAALAKAPGGPERTLLERFQHRSKRFARRFDEAYREWNRGVQERMNAYYEREQIAYDQTLAPPPLPPSPKRP